MLNENDYLQYDGLALAELIHSRQVSALEVADAAIQRIEKLNPAINAVIHKMYASAREQAQQTNPDAVFTGVPFLIKDLGLTYQGEPENWGSRYLQNYVPDYDGELAKRFRQAGILVLGKTNVPELGLSFHTEPAAFGPCHNPWHLDKTPGGSSGGAAAAVAAGMVPLAHANDGGGSIRIPASCCGLFGLKPSRGRIPLGPDIGKGWQGCVTSHVVSKSVRDSAAMLDAIAGSDLGAPFIEPPRPDSFLQQCQQPPHKLRIGVIQQPIFPAKKLHPHCSQALEETIALCSSLGHSLEPIQLHEHSMELAHHFTVLVAGEITALLEEMSHVLGRKAKSNELEITTRLMRRLGTFFSAKDFAYMSHYFDIYTRQIAQLFTQYDVLLSPTLNEPPVDIGHYQLSTINRWVLEFTTRFPNRFLLRKALKQIKRCAYLFSPFTPLFNITGNPAASIPLAWDEDNLPIGMQFISGMGREDLLFRLASQLEQAQPWQPRLLKMQQQL
jgi:amidase